MPGPFPGMDPYLEAPALWSGVHHGLITFLTSAVNALLPSRYVAQVGERVYVVQPDRSIYPDVSLSEARPRRPAGAATAVAVASDPPWELTVRPERRREAFLEILLVGTERTVVTVLEVLSPSNKASGNPGRELYRTKQRELLRSRANLIEVDLLRRGRHTVAAPRPALTQRGHWNYLVSLHRGGQARRYEVWPVTLRQRLPRIRVPLADGDADVVLDLQAPFDRCYDEGGYARVLDYRRAPAVRLPVEDMAWAEALLRERGLREADLPEASA